MQLDVRGPRFAAAVTTLVLIVILLTANAWIALAQTVVFAIGALSARHAPYGAVFRTFVAKRLGPPREFEPAAPVRFAQGVGAVFGLVATMGYFTGASAVGYVGAGGALVAAFLNAAFGVCLGCEMYLVLRRARGHRPARAS
jgi:hypothetical protein